MMVDDQTESECSICLDEFKTPRVLPCIHTFCEKCLQNDMTQRHIKEEALGYKWTWFTCPICRHVCNLPELNENTSIAEFVKCYPINYYINPKTCAKHGFQITTMECMTSGIDMCPGCIIDGHNGCLIFIRRGAKKQMVETLVDVLNCIIEAVSLLKKDGHRILAEANEKKKEEEKRLNYFSERYFRLEKKMAILHERALKMQNKICETICAIDDSQGNYTFSNGMGDADRLKNQLLEILKELQTHARIPEKYQRPQLSKFYSKLNSAHDNETDSEINTSIEEQIPEEISYFFLNSRNRTNCFKIVNIKVLPDCSVIVLCQTPNKLVKLSWCGEFISELLFKNQPSDMCLKEDGEIAVSFCYRQRLDFIDVSESRLYLMSTLETRRLYQKIATYGRNGLLACHSERIDILKTMDNYLHTVRQIALFDPIDRFDYINDIIIFSTFVDRHIFSYNIVENRLCAYYLPETMDNLPVDISCSRKSIYSLFTKARVIYRMKTPDGLFNESDGKLPVRIGKPYKIHVNNSNVMTTCSTNRNRDRFLVQIFKFSHLAQDFCF